jgi:hypothetical protein
MLELMSLFLATTAAYPVLAAVPFSMAFPLQLVLAAALLHVSPTLCELGLASCHAAGPFYVALAEGLGTAALVVPVAPQWPSLPPYESCRAAMLFIVAVFICWRAFDTWDHRGAAHTGGICSRVRPHRPGRPAGQAAQRLPAGRSSCCLCCFLLEAG